MKCPINLTTPDDCEHCIHGKLSSEDYEYRCTKKNYLNGKKAYKKGIMSLRKLI